MNRLAVSLLATLLFGVADLPAQDEPVAELPWTAALTLANDEQVRGVVTLEGDSVIVTPAEGDPLRTSLDGLRRLAVTAPEVAPQEPAPETILTGALPQPWRTKDIGRLAVPGKTRWSEDQFVLSASPRAEDENFDAFHLVYMPMSGDGEIVARVVKIGGPDAEEGSFGGIIMCDGLTRENTKSLLSVAGGGKQQINFRRWGYQGGSSSGKEDSSIVLPYWLKLVREKHDVNAYHSVDGRHWRFLKNSPGKMRDEQIYVGLAARFGEGEGPGEIVIDHVSVNGVGSKLVEPMLPHLVLRSGSILAADIERADRTAFHLTGRWKGRAITTPQVARLEFYHPLPPDLEKLVQGERPGLLLRSGDYAPGDFDSMAAGKVKVGSVLFGVKEYSVIDEVDALVLRPVVPPSEPAPFRLETQAGSVLFAQKATFVGGELVVEVAGLGEARFGVEEIAVLERVAPE